MSLRKFIGRGYLLTFGLIILIIFGVQLLDVSGEVEREVFRQLWSLRKVAVDSIVSEIDAYVSIDEDWQSFDYAQLLKQPVSLLDNFPNSSIALYDCDMNLLSDHIILSTELIVEPIDEPTVMAAIRSDPHGREVVIPVDLAGDSDNRTFYYFRWLPSGQHYERRYVLISAMNMQSVAADAPSRALLGWSVRLLIAAACTIIIAGVTVATYPRQTQEARHARE